MDSKAHAEYRITRPFIALAQNESLLRAWFQEPTDRLFKDLETMSPREFFRFSEREVWGRVGQYKPNGPRRRIADRFFSIRAAMPDDV
eukprot:2351582-Pyramimonas_sp.AAC.1